MSPFSKKVECSFKNETGHHLFTLMWFVLLQNKRVEMLKTSLFHKLMLYVPQNKVITFGNNIGGLNYDDFHFSLN